VVGDYLRSMPVFSGVISEFDPDTAPDDPAPLFTQWLREAAEDGVPEPHAMTVSTCDDAGLPDARVLILKDLDEPSWRFATKLPQRQGVTAGRPPGRGVDVILAADRPPGQGPGPHRGQLRPSTVPQIFVPAVAGHARSRWPATKTSPYQTAWPAHRSSPTLNADSLGNRLSRFGCYGDEVGSDNNETANSDRFGSASLVVGSYPTCLRRCPWLNAI
jgi:hypothetical protein